MPKTFSEFIVSSKGHEYPKLVMGQGPENALPADLYLQAVNAGPSRENILANALSARQSAAYQAAQLQAQDELKLRSRRQMTFLADLMGGDQQEVQSRMGLARMRLKWTGNGWELTNESPTEDLGWNSPPGMNQNTSYVEKTEHLVPTIKTMFGDQYYDPESFAGSNLNKEEAARMKAEIQNHNWALYQKQMKNLWQQIGSGYQLSTGETLMPEDFMSLSDRDRMLAINTMGEQMYPIGAQDEGMFFGPQNLEHRPTWLRSLFSQPTGGEAGVVTDESYAKGIGRFSTGSGTSF